MVYHCDDTSSMFLQIQAWLRYWFQASGNATVDQGSIYASLSCLRLQEVFVQNAQKAINVAAPDRTSLMVSSLQPTVMPHEMAVASAEGLLHPVQA